MKLNTHTSALAITIAVGMLSANTYADDTVPLFDSPWIGYDTAVYPEGLSPQSSRVADFNGDSIPDLATTSWGGTPWLSILMGDGKGGYLPPVTYQLELESLDLAVADFDNDGDMDIVTCDTSRRWEGFSVSLWKNNGSGGFSFFNWYDIGNTGPSSITVADFNSDGFVDIATANDKYIVCNNTVSVLMNSGGNGFQGAQVYSISGCTRAIDSGDIDGDGIPDLVIGHETNKWTYMRNTGNGSFVTQLVNPGIEAGSIPELPTVHLADVDLDGDVDVFFSNRDTGGVNRGAVALWRNNGDGTFGAGERHSFNWHSSGAINVETADVTGNGWPDILSATASGRWFLIPSDGNGGFLPARRFRAGQASISMEATDLDLDGDKDIVVLAASSLEACVYLNPGDGNFVQPFVIDMVNPNIAPAFTTNLESADIDHDGDLDLAVGYRSDFSDVYGISIRRNNGDGTFAAVENYSEFTHLQYLQLNDINNDGFVDLVYIDSGSRLRVRFNQGDGSFGSRNSSHVIADRTSMFELHDVDNDGDNDVVSSSGFVVAVLKNNGSGSWAAPMYYDVGFANHLGMGDLNADGILDLLTDSGVQGYPVLHFGNGDGTFSSPTTVTTGRSVVAFAVEDVDNDGNMDFAAIYNLDETGLSVRRGRPGGIGFFPNANYHGSYDRHDHTSTLKLVDADGDGVLDAFTANFGAQDFSFWKGNPDGTFQELVRYGIGEVGFDLNVGDFTGDGIVDVAVATQSDAGRWWYTGVVLIEGVPPDSGSTQADLMGVEVVNGTLLDGELADLVASDDSYVHTRSGFGPTLVDLHNMEMVISAVTVVDAPATLDLTIESRIDQPSGSAQIKLKNWTTGQFVSVGQYAIGSTDQVNQILGIDAASYVSDSGFIEMSIKHLVFVPFLAFIFESFVDEVQINVR